MDVPQSRFELFSEEKYIFLLSRFEPESFHPVTIPYNDYAIAAPKMF